MADDTRSGTSGRVQGAAERAHGLVDTRAPQAALDSACETIRARPLMSVGIALAAGYIIGRMR